MGYIAMTKEGVEKAKEKLKRLKSIERPKAIEAIATARAHGDLSENAEYDAAKERQAHLEGKIAELEEKLTRVQIIDTSNANEILFGAHVKVQEDGFPEVEEYHLLGREESNPDKGIISTESPMGKAFLNRKKGDTVKVDAPNGSFKMKILDFWYE